MDGELVHLTDDEWFTDQVACTKGVHNAGVPPLLPEGVSTAVEWSKINEGAVGPFWRGGTKAGISCYVVFRYTVEGNLIWSIICQDLKSNYKILPSLFYWFFLSHRRHCILCLETKSEFSLCTLYKTNSIVRDIIFEISQSLLWPSCSSFNHNFHVLKAVVCLLWQPQALNCFWSDPFQAKRMSKSYVAL